MSDTDFIIAGHVLVQNPIEHTHYGYETASWYDKLILQPGRYPIRLTRIDGRPWKPGVIESGYVRPGRPYYAAFDVDALLVETYTVSRLFTESRAHTDVRNKYTTHHVRLYAYVLDTMTTWMGCPIVPVPKED